MLYPTSPIMPSKIEEIHGPDWTIEVKGERVSQFMLSAKNVDVASAANLPAITLPTSSMSNKDNMPIGMELASITGYDRKLIAVARSLENIILGHEHK